MAVAVGAKDAMAGVRGDGIARGNCSKMWMRQVTTKRQALPAWLLAAAVVVGAGLGGCATNNNAHKLLNPDPPGKMLAGAENYLARGRFVRAAKKFEALERDHPYAREARRAIVMAAYAYFRAGKFPEAIATARRYTTMHPGTKEAAFAHHIIASCYFEEMRGPRNDQTNTRKALAEYRTLQARYPNSKYARDAENRIRIALDSLAAHEMTVGRYYQSKRNHMAAINRFKTVVGTYQNTAHVEEALMRLTESYMVLGLKKEAQTAAAILGYNFPNSKWYKYSYELLKSDGLAPREESGSWLSGVFKNFKLPKVSL